MATIVSPSSIWRPADVDGTLEVAGRGFISVILEVEGEGDVNGSETSDDAEIGAGAHVVGVSGLDRSLLCTELGDTERGVFGAGRLGSTTARFVLL